MLRFRLVGSTLVLLALMASSVHADDVCGGDDARRKATTDARAAIAKAEQSGNQADVFLANQITTGDDCLAKDLRDKARMTMAKLGRELAGKAEAKGQLYSSQAISVQQGEQRRGNEQASAFAWFEALGEYPEANRVMLKAMQAKSDDLPLFKAAWEVDQNRLGPPDPKTGDRRPYASPPTYRQELLKLASANADKLMKAEEKDAQGLSGSAAEVGMATMKSLEKLRTAAEWMKFLPGGDKSARDRAEQRGDVIMKRSDPTFTQGNARGYYEFAGSTKAKEKIAQLDKKSGEAQQAMEKAGEKLKGAFKQQNEAEQKKFDKKKADLEKELGF